MSEWIRHLVEMIWALLWCREIRLAKGARVFGKVRKSSESIVHMGTCARVDGIEIHGRGTLRIGAKVELKNIYIDFGLSGGVVSIEDDVYIANGAKLIIFGELLIGAGSIIGPDVMIVDTRHVYGHGQLLRASGVRVNNVVVGANCWIGGRASIMPGVRIERDVVIAAGSVVTRNCESYGVYAGVPAKRIKGYE
jgi:maltose O-acetyltransferase